MDEQERERERRIEALSALGQGDAGAPATTTLPNGHQARQTHRDGVTEVARRDLWRRVVLLSLIILVIVGGGSAAYVLLSRQHKTVTAASAIPAALTIDLTAANLYCPRAYAWSHDGRAIAVLAADITCREAAYQSSPQTMKVGLLDARTGKLTRTLTFMDIFAKHGLTVRWVDVIAWTPDDSALTLFVQDAVAPAARPDMPMDNEALIVYPLAGTSAGPTLLSAPWPEGASPQGGQQLVWNLHTMSVGPTIYENLPPALTYRWTADGRIVADQPLPTDLSAPTGRAASGGSFSLWQDGQIVPETLSYGGWNPTSQQPTAQFFTSSPALWSPDGQYVVFGIHLGGAVGVAQVMGGPPACASVGQTHGCLPIPMPLPDQAFETVIAAAWQGETRTQSDGTPSPPNWPSVPVQWSPNGAMLLTILPGNEEHDNATGASLTVFSVATGQPVKMFRVGDGQPGATCGMNELVGWSPTGTQLAMGLCGANTLTILSTQGLAA